MVSEISRLRRVGLLPLAISLFVFLAGNSFACFSVRLESISLGNFGFYQTCAFFTAQAGVYCCLERNARAGLDI